MKIETMLLHCLMDLMEEISGIFGSFFIVGNCSKGYPSKLAKPFYYWLLWFYSRCNVEILNIYSIKRKKKVLMNKRKKVEEKWAIKERKKRTRRKKKIILE